MTIVRASATATVTEPIAAQDQIDATRPGYAGDIGARAGGVVLAFALLGVTVALSLLIGAGDIAPAEAWRAIFDSTDAHAHAVMWELRIPRTAVALVVGAALGVCGALIQAYTRNPLADPGILGVNAGAALAVTLAIAIVGVGSAESQVWFAFLGALVVTVVVYAVGSTGPGQATPEKLTLAGVAIAAVLAGVTDMITFKNPAIFAGSLSWSIGSVGGRSLELLATITPFIVVGLVLAFVLARPLNALSLGDELGRSLGASPGRIRAGTVVAVTVLAGGATALAGPIAFVGLMVPHAVRWFTGPDQRWIIPGSALAAAILLIASDIVGRIALPTGELPVGVVTAFIGAPVLIVLARRRGARGL